MDKIGTFNPMTLIVIGGCHSLTNIEGKLVGDPLEWSSFEALAWNVNINSGTTTSKSGDYSIRQIKKFLFDSQLKWMSCIAEGKHHGGGKSI